MWVVSGWQKLRKSAEGLRRNCLAVTDAILSRYLDVLRFTYFLDDFGQKVFFLGVKNSVSWARNALVRGIYQTEMH